MTISRSAAAHEDVVYNVNRVGDVNGFITIGVTADALACFYGFGYDVGGHIDHVKLQDSALIRTADRMQYDDIT
jgi:hypothetical protein